MCASAGGVKLLDFGIAEALGEDPSARTETGAFKGKLSYMSPERVKASPSTAGGSVFPRRGSLGVAGGAEAVPDEDRFDTLKNVAEVEVPPLSSLRSDVPPELDAIVARALARDPAQRYATGRLADDLDRLLETLRYQSRALPELLHELFGAELTSRQIPTTALTNEMLAACRADPSSSRSGGSDPTPVASARPRHWPTSTASPSVRGGDGGADPPAVALALLGRRAASGPRHWCC